MKCVYCEKNVRSIRESCFTCYYKIQELDKENLELSDYYTNEKEEN